MFHGPVELQAQFLQGDLALPIELALEQHKGVKQVAGQQRDQQTGRERIRAMRQRRFPDRWRPAQAIRWAWLTRGCHNLVELGNVLSMGDNPTGDSCR